MAAAVIMPRQGQSVERCILTTWYKKVGEEVSRGELLFAYETDKAAFEEEAREEGVLLVQFFGEGEEVPVLENVAVIGERGEAVDHLRPATLETSPKTRGYAETRSDPPGQVGIAGTKNQVLPMAPDEGGRNAAISPRAKKLAREKRVVVDSLRGTGPGGRVLERDVLDEIKNGKRLTPLARKIVEGTGMWIPARGTSPYGKITSRDLVDPSGTTRISNPAVSSGSFTDIPLSNVRKLIAGAMHRSLQNSAQLTHHLSANASRMLKLRKEVKRRVTEGYPHQITLNDMVCFAAIQALKKFPAVNAHLLEGKIRQFGKVSLGLAVDTDRGLLVPALPNADDLSLPGLSDRLKEMAESSREGKISPDLLSPEAASFTVSNLGNYGVEMFTPVINLPQVAILGVNTIIQRPVMLDEGSFDFQPFIGLSLTYDHRAIDGGPATLFLAEIRDQVEGLSSELL